MSTSSTTARERQITRAIHGLFWRANLVDTPGLVLAYIFRIPAFICANVLTPLVIAYGLQAIIANNTTALPRYAWYIVILAVVYSACWIAGSVFVTRNGTRGATFVQREVFSNYLQKDFEFYGNTYLGALSAQATRLRDSYIDYAMLITLQGPKQLTIISASIIVIAVASPLLAGITLLTMAAILGFTLWSGKWRLRYRRVVSEASSELAGVVGDALSQAPVVKSFASERYEEQRLQLPLLDWARKQRASWLSATPGDNGRMILVALATAVLLLVTSHMYHSAQISIALVILVQLYVVRLITVTYDIAEIIKTYEAIMGNAYQPVSTLLVQPEVIDLQNPAKLPAKPGVAFTNAGFAYEQAAAKPAVANFNLTIKSGEKVGLVGYSGSGKTTLTKLLLRFMDVTSGSITLGDVDVRDLAQHDLRSSIAYVPQEPLLFHRSISENIAYGRPKASKKAVHEAARLAYVNEFATDLPQGFDTLVGERGIKLSGGQRQRIAIARALLKDAPILVLDEATSALDSQSEKLIQEALWRLMKDRTALVIAHRLSTIQRMDRIVVMDKGRIVQVGSHEELLRQKKGIYAKLWAHQSGGYVGVPNPTEQSAVAAQK